MSIGIFRINTNSPAPVGGLTVKLTASGTATPDVDYVAIPASVTIPQGQTFADVTITPITDALVEGDETVIIDVAADPAYTIGTASSTTITLVDANVPPPLPQVTLSPVQNTANEAAVVLNDSTSHTSITYTNNFLTATTTSAGVTFATLARNSGKYAFEIVFNNLANSFAVTAGVAEGSHPLSAMIGQTATSYGFRGNDFKRNNGSLVAANSGIVLAQGDALLFEIDFVAGDIIIKRNTTTTTATIFTGVNLTTVPLFPAIYLSAAAEVTFNFGATPFVNTPDADFLNWDGS